MIYNIRLILLAVMAATLLAGCPKAVNQPCYGKTLPQLLDATNLKPLFQEMASELCNESVVYVKSQPESTDTSIPPVYSCNNSDLKKHTVLVTDFVDISSYMPERAGLLMGELMRGSLNQVCCYRIVQAEFGKYFKLNEEGLVSLTRRVSEIKKDDVPQPEAVIGTYNYLNNSKVVLFVRRINTNTGQVVKMVTRELDYSCAGRNISYDVR